MALTDHAHELISKYFNQDGFQDSRRPLNLAVDATVGNGHDTAFLASLKFRKVIGFDIQASAILTTRLRLSQAVIKNVLLLQQSHADLNEFVHEPIDCIVFNLGYLPGADKSITTTRTTTLLALQSAMDWLSPIGIITIICYPGHPAGAEETAAVQAWLDALDGHWKVDSILSSAPGQTTPILYFVHPLNGQANQH
ncbi:MAG: 16S rRNA (cytosine(1402)-N(4))-methyltransferase [Gammaproteobacteria bacterium]|nr:16S rRNA (cytosine(1402)-N(4))-methyltransferase [Gammaproteobacteria bacterium]